MKISQRVFELLRGHEIMTDGQTDRQTERQTDGQGDYFRAPPTSSGVALISVQNFSVNTLFHRINRSNRQILNQRTRKLEIRLHAVVIMN